MISFYEKFLEAEMCLISGMSRGSGLFYENDYYGALLKSVDALELEFFRGEKCESIRSLYP